jgi:RnfABCDGE-type electron transport complex G subunit
VREKVRMVLVLVVLSAISALLLALIDYVSSDIIEANRKRGMKMAVLSALSVPLEDRTVEEVFASAIRELDTEAGVIYLSSAEDEMDGSPGLAFKVSGPGFWGPISMLLAVDMKDFSIRGIEIIEQEETPGLGARIEEPSFREGFRGKLLTKAIRMRGKGEEAGPNDVAAITGATISSKAVERIVNEASRPYVEAMRELNLD